MHIFGKTLLLQPRVLGNFKFTYTSAGNLHTQVLANAIANLPIHGKYIPLTKTIKKFVKTMQIYHVTKKVPVNLYHKKFTASSFAN